MKTAGRGYVELLIHYLRPQRWRVVLLGVLLLSTTGLQLVNPQLVRLFIDTTVSSRDLGVLTQAALAYIGIALLIQALAVGVTYVGENIGWTATNRLREDLASHSLSLDIGFLNTKTPGEFIERLDGDVTALSNFFSQFALRILGSGLVMLGVLVLFWREDWRIGLAMSIFAALALAAITRMRDWAVPLLTAERQATAALFGFIEERLAGMEDIRPNGGQAYVLRRLHERMRAVYRVGWRGSMISLTVWALTFSLFAVGNVTALGLGAYFYLGGSITIGTIFLFFQYATMLRGPLEQIASQMKEFQKTGASMARCAELLGFRPQILDGVGETSAPGALSVEFDNVSFAYGEDERVIKDLSVSLEPGAVLGLLGRTGSGKTTLARLIYRLYDIQAGAIRLGGVDVRSMRLADLRRRVGLVTQDVQLFQASVRDNLTFFDPSIPNDRILAVLDLLGLRAWYTTLPNGLDTELAAGGGGLSAGEAQLLAFARVFLQDPGLVILDEASSRLDPATEALIERAVDRLLEGRSAIIIAHRLATVQRANDILILDAGRIQEYGSRITLANAPNSRFRQLLQTGLEEVLA